MSEGGPGQSRSGSGNETRDVDLIQKSIVHGWTGEIEYLEDCGGNALGTFGYFVIVVVSCAGLFRL